MIGDLEGSECNRYLTNNNLKQLTDNLPKVLRNEPLTLAILWVLVDKGGGFRIRLGPELSRVDDGASGSAYLVNDEAQCGELARPVADNHALHVLRI